MVYSGYFLHFRNSRKRHGKVAPLDQLHRKPPAKRNPAARSLARRQYRQRVVLDKRRKEEGKRLDREQHEGRALARYGDFCQFLPVPSSAGVPQSERSAQMRRIAHSTKGLRKPYPRSHRPVFANFLPSGRAVVREKLGDTFHMLHPPREGSKSRALTRFLLPENLSSGFQCARRTRLES